VERNPIAAVARGFLVMAVRPIADPRRHRRGLSRREQHPVTFVELHGPDAAFRTRRSVAVGWTVSRSAIVQSMAHMPWQPGRRAYRSEVGRFNGRRSTKILTDNPAVRARTHGRTSGRRAATSGGTDDREAPDHFLGCDDGRDGPMPAQFAGAGKRRGDDDQGTTGEAKHPAQQAKQIPAQIPGISFPRPTCAYKSGPPPTISVARLISVRRSAPIRSRTPHPRPNR
jgi:hypothetical protein